MFTCSTTHKVFLSLTYQQRYNFVDQVMIARGNAVNYLIDYVQNNIEEEWKESYFDEKCHIIQSFFF